MRFKTIAFSLIVSSAVFILGCDDDDDSSSIVGGNLLSIQVTIDPPLDSSLFSFVAFNESGAVSGPSVFPYHTAHGFTTRELAVTKGQNLTVQLKAQSLHSTNYCSDIEVKTMLNGIPFDVRKWNMGGGYTTSCPDGHIHNYMLTIP